MRDQRLQVNETCRDESDGLGVGVVVPVLESDVDLLGRHVRKGHVLEILAAPNDEHHSTEATRVNSRLDARLDASALENQLCLCAQCLFDLFCHLLGAELGVHLDRPNSGDEFLGELETGLVQVGDDDGRGTRSVRREQRDQPDRAGAADDDGVAEAQVGPVDAGQGDRQGLEKRALLERELVGQRVQPLLRVHVVPRQGAVVRRRREEDDLGAGVVPPVAAVVAARLHARDAALEGHAVAGLEFGDARADVDDDARALVAEAVFTSHHHVTNVALFPKVHVGSADAGRAYVDQALALACRRDVAGLDV